MIEQVNPELKEKRREVTEIKAIQDRGEILEWIEEKKKHFEESEAEQKEKTKDKELEEKESEADEDEETDKRTETKEEEDVSIEEIDEKLDDILDEEDLSDV